VTVLFELAPIASEDPLDLESEEVGESGQNKNVWIKDFVNNANTGKFDFFQRSAFDKIDVLFGH